MVRSIKKLLMMSLLFLISSCNFHESIYQKKSLKFIVDKDVFVGNVRYFYVYSLWDSVGFLIPHNNWMNVGDTLFLTK